MLPNRLSMPPADDRATWENNAASGSKAPSPPPRHSYFRTCQALFSLGSLAFLFGAAVVYFNLPLSTFLKRAFGGGVAWYEQSQAPSAPGVKAPPLKVGNINQPGRACDGFTLCMYGGDSRAVLINMRGEVVHRWHVPFSTLWPDPPHLYGPVQDSAVYFNDGHVYPNGDLVVVIEGPVDLRNSSNGYGLAKIDKDSHVLWKYPQKCHHDVDVGDDGKIYAIANEVVASVPPGLEDVPTPCMVDVLHVISPQGRTLKEIPLLEALQDSPYAPLLCMLETPKAYPSGMAPGPTAAFVEDPRRRDVLHTNAVKVLSQTQAKSFPMFKAGQLLVSLRHLDTLAVVDPDSGKVVWAERGPWHAQHDPSFLDNGHLLLFDNQGSPRGSRVLEFDLVTQAFPWSYPGDRDRTFFSRIRGMSQRLPNGNTLIVNSDAGEVFEVTSTQEVVWSCSCGRVELNRARRYLPEQLPFVKGAQHGLP
jgi:hypothetical protein